MLSVVVTPSHRRLSRADELGRYPRLLNFCPTADDRSDRALHSVTDAADVPPRHEGRSDVLRTDCVPSSRAATTSLRALPRQRPADHPRDPWPSPPDTPQRCTDRASRRRSSPSTPLLLRDAGRAGSRAAFARTGRRPLRGEVQPAAGRPRRRRGRRRQLRDRLRRRARPRCSPPARPAADIFYSNPVKPAVPHPPHRRGGRAPLRRRRRRGDRQAGRRRPGRGDRRPRPGRRHDLSAFPLSSKFGAPPGRGRSGCSTTPRRAGSSRPGSPSTSARSARTSQRLEPGDRGRRRPIYTRCGRGGYAAAGARHRGRLPRPLRRAGAGIRRDRRRGARGPRRDAAPAARGRRRTGPGARRRGRRHRRRGHRPGGARTAGPGCTSRSAPTTA